MTPARRLRLLEVLVARRRLLRDLAVRELARLEAREAALLATAGRCQDLLLTAGPGSGVSGAGPLLAGATLRDLLARAASDGEARAATLTTPIRTARAEVAAARAALSVAEDAHASALRDLATAAEATALAELPTISRRSPAQ
jgi:hypothetical protein